MENTVPPVENSVIELGEEALATAAAVGYTIPTTSALVNNIPIIDLSESPDAGGSGFCQKTAQARSDATSAAAAATVLATQELKTDSAAASTSSGIASTSTNTLECPICLQSCIHPARLPCGHIFCFLCVKGVANKNRRCAMCRREIPPEFLDHPQLVYGIEDISTTKATEDGFQWYYEGRNGGWWAYDKRSSKEIEDAYQEYIDANLVVELDDFAIYELLLCGKLYDINFKDMVQFPSDNPMRRRKIRRDKHMPTKGIAGICNVDLTD